MPINPPTQEAIPEAEQGQDNASEVKSTPEQNVESEVNQEQVQGVEKTVEQDQQVEDAQSQVQATDDSEQELPQEKSEDQKAIEEIMSYGLDDLYKELPDNRKEEFKQKGEETASQITVILNKAKVQVHKIVKLITSWLKIIPGVNKFYLEKASKIKTDKIIKYTEEKAEGGMEDPS